MPNIIRATCGHCMGDGFYTNCDVGGGKWRERCSQCEGRGTVDVVETVTQQEVTSVKPLVRETKSTPDDSATRFSLLELE